MNQAIQKHRKGQPLEDNELKIATNELTKIVAALRALDERFTLAHKELSQTLDLFQAYRHSRQQN